MDGAAIIITDAWHVTTALRKITYLFLYKVGGCKNFKYYVELMAFLYKSVKPAPLVSPPFSLEDWKEILN